MRRLAICPGRIGVAPLAIALVAAAGCGGSSSSSTEAGTSAASAAGTQPTTTAQLPASDRAEAEAKVNATKPDLGSPSEVPQAKGGDNSIQGFGAEASPAERLAAARVLSAYLEAYANGDAKTACALLASGVTQLLERGLSTAGGSAVSCTQAMARLTSNITAAQRDQVARARVLSLRVGGDRAFAIYRGTGNQFLALPMAKEGGAWRVGAVAGTPLL